MAAVLGLGVARARLLLKGGPAPQNGTGWKLDNVCLSNLSGEQRGCKAWGSGASSVGGLGSGPPTGAPSAQTQAPAVLLYMSAGPALPTHTLPTNATLAESGTPMGSTTPSAASVGATVGGGGVAAPALPRTAAAAALPAGGAGAAGRPAALAVSAPVAASGAGGAAGGMPAGATLGFRTGEDGRREASQLSSPCAGAGCSALLQYGKAALFEG